MFVVIMIPSTLNIQASVLGFWIGTSPFHYSQAYFKEILGTTNLFFCITYIMIIFISFAEFSCLSGNSFLNRVTTFDLTYRSGQLTKNIVSLIFMYLPCIQIISSQYRNYGKLILFFNI